MCSLYNSNTSNGLPSGAARFTHQPSFSAVLCAKAPLTTQPSPVTSSPSARSKKMKGKTPVLVLSQQPQSPTQPQSHFQRTQSFGRSPQQYQHAHHQQHQQRPPQRRNQYNGNGNAGYRNQFQHQQQNHHHYDYNHFQQDDEQQTSYHSSSFFSTCNNTTRAVRPSSRPYSGSSHSQSRSSSSSLPPTPPAAEAAAATTTTTTATGTTSIPLPKSPVPESAKDVGAVAVTKTATNPTMTSSLVPIVTLAAAGSDTLNSDPEPVMEVDSSSQLQHGPQSNRQDQGPRSGPMEIGSHRSQLALQLGLGLCPPSLESDMSSNSSQKESSDCDTFGTEDDENKIPGSDSNDTDSILGDSLSLERRSRRKRSMQRLLAKNRTLKSSLAQAKADLASERHNRAVIDQIYLKIKKELNSKLEEEECKVATMKAEMEQMAAEMKELKEKSSSYRIGYDSSPYSLSNGLSDLGGLMLHHSNIMDVHDEAEEFPFIDDHSSTNVKGSTPSAQLTEKDDRKSIAEEYTKAGKEKQVTFLSPPEIPARLPTPRPEMADRRAATIGSVGIRQGEEEDDEDEYEVDEEEDGEGEDAPCTMMEIIMKKQRSQSPEDEVQDSPADANETFDSMAHKFLHQALHAKFTPARTILQLDDLLLKYDALPEDLVLVLAQEFMKWWETERVEAGGPVTGGWGVGTVIMNESGDRVSVKVAVETRFKAIYVPLLLNYVASHQEQLMLLEKLERNAKTSDKLMRNHVSQLMALYKFDVLDADAILEWWRLLKEPAGVFGHGHGLRSMSSQFVAWLEDEEEDSEEEDSDEDDDESEDDDDEDSDSDDEPLVEYDSADGQNKFVGLELIRDEQLLSPGGTLQSLSEALDRKEGEEMMVIGSDDGMDDHLSTTSSLERIEECERKRRISFCTNNVYINQDGRVRIDKAPVVDDQGKKLRQCPAMVEEEEDDEDDNVEDDDDEEENNE